MKFLCKKMTSFGFITKPLLLLLSRLSTGGFLGSTGKMSKNSLLLKCPLELDLKDDPI